MSKIITSFILGVTLIIAPLIISIPNNAKAQVVNDHYSVPLTIIRFNQPEVHFYHPLTNAIKHALQVNPNINFNIVQYIPNGDQMVLHRAEANLHKVLGTLYDMNIRNDKISVQRKLSNGILTSEVHIFVR